MLLDICVNIIIFLIAFNLVRFIPGLSSYDRRILLRLCWYHFVIAIAFHFYLVSFGGDAVHYWNNPRERPFYEIWNSVQGGSATSVIYMINYFPSKVLSLSFFTGNMLYALVGYIGFVYFYKALRGLVGSFEVLQQVKFLNIPIFPWIWFLPNLHFWSSGIGKDALLFTCIALFFYAFLDVRRRWMLLAISLAVSLAIRPHITLFLLLSFSIGYTLDGRMKSYQKGLVFLVLVAGFVSIFTYVLEFIQLESLEVLAVEEFASTRASNLNKLQTGSGVDISQYPFPMKVFTFLYRPFFFDINGILAIIASVENLLLLVFTFMVVRNKPFWAIRQSGYWVKSAVFFFLIGTVAFSLILGNLGIMLRQKNMFIPVLILFGLWVLHRNKKRLMVPS